MGWWFYLEVVGTPHHYFIIIEIICTCCPQWRWGAKKSKKPLEHSTSGERSWSWKKRSRAFKQKKNYQNRTIIKEVRSKNVILHIPVCTRFQFAHSSLHIALHERSWSSTSARGVARALVQLKEEVKSFQTKKNYQNRTIIKEVRSKNVILHIPVCTRFQFAHSSLHIALHERSWSSTSARGVARALVELKEEIRSFQTKKKLSKSDHY